MQIDLHHAAVYALCRISGMSSHYAEIVAFASQYVDDAVHQEALIFKNGGVFKQIQTGHRFLNPKEINVNEALDVWLPFHFLPNGELDSSDPFLTAPNSKVLALLLEDIRCSSSENVLYRLGIGLHCFADAYAHQDFKGLYDTHNNVRLLAGVEKKGAMEYSGRLGLKLFDRRGLSSPSIGHAEAFANPDIPYAIWEYSRQGKTFKVNNLEERYLPGVKNIYDYLVYFLGRNPQYTSGCQHRPFEAYLDIFRELLSYQGTKEERHENWLQNIRENRFEFPDFNEIDRSLVYNEQAWFEQAVEVIRVPRTKNLSPQRADDYTYHRKKNFADSHWVKFMQAAAEHRFLIIHCFLPELGIIVG
ncbi:MAG TPA: hypothetical protein GXX46_09550 [Peptococcaceae bacterium]|nr:hypothetical protein [Peptococcaceae bacterium]